MRGCWRLPRGRRTGGSGGAPLVSVVVIEVAQGSATSAVFHWINVTGERRLRFNYHANLRFNRACAPDAPHGARGRERSAGRRLPDNEKWIGKMVSEMIAMKLPCLSRRAVGDDSSDI